jgi:hypothetical protein
LVSIIAVSSCGDSTRPKAPARLVVVAGADEAITVATAVDIVVRVEDVDGNGVPEVPVEFAVISGGGVLTTRSGEVTTSSGTASATFRLGQVAGVNTMRVSAAGLTPLTVSVTGVAGPTASIVKYEGDEQWASAGTAVAVPPAVRLTDAYGNPRPAVAVGFSVVAGGGNVVGPNAETDAAGIARPQGWTLGPTKGLNALTATTAGVHGVRFTATAGQRSPDITVSIQAPLRYDILGDDATVGATVTSRYQLVSVRAAVAGAESGLVLQNGSWRGTLDLRGTARDTIDLAVTATDVNGAITDAVVRIIHDHWPILTVASPLDLTVARPTLDVSATCTDDDPAGCRSIEVYTDIQAGLASGTTAINQPVSLAGYEGQLISLRFVAQDSRGTRTHGLRSIYVESSPRLVPIASALGRVWDVSSSLLLYRRAEPQRPPTEGLFVLRNMVSGVDETIPVRSNAFVRQAFVTPRGALVLVAGSPNQVLYDWRDGSLTARSDLNFGTALDIAGNYAVFGVGGTTESAATLYRRDLTTGADVPIATSTSNTGNSVASNGDVVFWRVNDNHIYRWRDGQTTRLTADDALWMNAYPITDGTRVVFRRRSPCCGPIVVQIVVYDGSSSTVLVERPTEAVPGQDYAVNNGWIAFTKPDAAGVLQAWIRSPSGESRQISVFGAATQIVALASDGAVIIASANRRYFAPPTGAPQDLSSLNGTMRWRDGRLVFLIGRSAFEVTR